MKLCQRETQSMKISGPDGGSSGHLDDDRNDKGRGEMWPLLLCKGSGDHQHRNGQQGLEVHLIFKRNRRNPHFCNGSEVI